MPLDRVPTAHSPSDGVVCETRRAIFTAPDVSRLPQWLPFVLVLAAALLLRRYVVPNVDVSWGLTIAEKILDGQRLYVDLIELNPPGAILLYLPPVMVARLFGLRPESVTDVLVIAAACASIWISGRVFDCRRFLAIDGWHLATLMAAVFTVLPAHTFGNRDPIALMALLPWLAVCALRAMRLRVPLAHELIGGVCCALAVIIKPHFVLAVLFAAVAAALCAKSWRVLLALENWIAAGLVLVYGVAITAAFPAFTEMLPMISAVYLARPYPVADMVPACALWLAIMVMIFDLRRRAVFDPPLCVLLAASCGCALAFLAQGKGWPYHSVPMLSLALLALAIGGNWLALPQANADAGERRGWLARTIIAGALVAACFCWNNRAADITRFAAKVRQLGPHPTMLTITSDISLGHPLVREVGGVWVGRVCSNWISTGVLLRRRFETLDAKTAARLDAYEAFDRVILVEDIARSRPDVILVEKGYFDWDAWARSDPRLREQLEAYRVVDTLDPVVILQRRS
jgi:hypothetical protein